jgi:hypothetical protein
MPANVQENPPPPSPTFKRPRAFFGRSPASRNVEDMPSTQNYSEANGKPTKWSMGVLNDPNTHEVPGQYSTIPLAVRDSHQLPF